MVFLNELGLKQYFRLDLPNIINLKKWKKLILKRLKIIWNEYYINALKNKYNSLTFVVLFQNDIISLRIMFYLKDQFLIEFMIFVNVIILNCMNCMHIHPSFFNILFGSHNCNWTRN